MPFKTKLYRRLTVNRSFLASDQHYDPGFGCWGLRVQGYYPKECRIQWKKVRVWVEGFALGFRVWDIICPVCSIPLSFNLPRVRSANEKKVGVSRSRGPQIPAQYIDDCKY